MREIRKYFFLMFVVFVFSSFLGYVFASENKEIAQEMIKKIISEFSIIKELSPMLLFAFIFINNSLKSLFTAILGLAFGFVPFCFVVSNGFIVGLALALKAKETGLINALLYIIPHGLLEIPAILLASSYGLWLGVVVIRKIRKKKVNLKESVKYVLINFVKIIFPILLIAAFIEVYLTPTIASFLNS